MKSTLQFLTTIFLAIGVSANWGPTILLAPACGTVNTANDALAKAARGASCLDDSVPLIIKKDEIHCLCGNAKIRDTIVKEILPNMCQLQTERESWVAWYNGHCKGNHSYKPIIITNTNVQTYD